MSVELLKLLQAQLDDIEAGWSIGSYGAIGEFHQRKSDDLQVDDLSELTRATEKGAIRLMPKMLTEVKAVAYETLNARQNRWSQGMVLCLPQAQAKMQQRSVLTELGSDVEAIREQDRDAVLFDMGLEQSQIDFCIRTADVELIEILRRFEGQSLLTSAHEAMQQILVRHPHRVVSSKLGRVEVYQKIGGPDTGGVSPDGPHTHVLPKPLATKRSHPASVPVPEGFLPCATLHPASAVMSNQGEDIAFNAERYDAFQNLLMTYGAEDYIATKRTVLMAFEKLTPASKFCMPSCILSRVALKNTLRQIGRIGDWQNDSPESQWLDSWQLQFDPVKTSSEL